MNLANFVYICITGGKKYPVDTSGYSFLTNNTKLQKICQLRKAIFSIVYNILEPNFAILLSLGCSFKLSGNIFPISIFFFKILSKRLKVHSARQ